MGFIKVKKLNGTIAAIVFVGLAFVLAASLSYATGYFNTGFFNNGAHLKITSAAQSILTNLCSGNLTIETDNRANVPTNVAANLTLNLGAVTNLTYYSDSSCSAVITSTTVASGTNAQTIYFQSSVAGSYSVSATASGYSATSQNETVSVNPFIWTGGGGNTAWSTGGNWSGSAAPGAGDVAVFNGSCSSNCSPTTTGAVTIAGLRMDSGYSGTITQGAFSFTVGTNVGWTQIAGTFVGNGSGAALTVYAPFTVSGGSFTSTSGTLTINGGPPFNFSVTGSTFHANGGSLIFSPPWAFQGSSIAPGTSTYNNVTIGSNANTITFNNGTMTIAGNLVVGNNGYGVVLSSGTLAVAGNVSAVPSSSVRGSAIIKLTGNGAGQTVSTGGYPNLLIAAGTNNVTLSGTIDLSGSDANNIFKVQSVGTLTTTGSTLYINSNAWLGASTCYPIFGSFNYNNLSFTGSLSTVDLGGNTVNVTGNLILHALSYGLTVSNGTLAVSGTVTNNSIGVVGGTVAVTMKGSSSSNVTLTAASFPAGNVIVNKTGGANVSLTTNVSWTGGSQNTSVTAGSISMAGFNLSVDSLTLSAGTSITRGGGTLKVNGATIGAGAYSGGTIF